LSGSFPPPGDPLGTPPPPGPGPQTGPPAGPPPSWTAPTGQPAPAWSGAAHKPGAVPLRPLGLGDMYDAAFRIIRYNPAATVGSAVLVTAVAMAIPVVVTGVLSGVMDLSAALDPSDGPSREQLAGFLASMGSLVLGGLLQSSGLILVTGMIAHVTMAAAIGRRLTLGQAWAATRGQRWRLIGLTFLLGLLSTLLLAVIVGIWVAVVIPLDGWAIFWFSLVAGPVSVAVVLVFWVRIYYLAVPALMLEDLRVTRALGRARRLTARAFWRTFGIALLTLLIAQIGGALLSTPVTLIGQAVTSLGGVSPDSVMLLVLTQAVSSVVAAAFVAPFVTAVTCLQYVDLRIRKEAFDVELLTRAGLSRP